MENKVNKDSKKDININDNKTNNKCDCEECVKLKEELKVEKERVLKNLADFLNYKKRIEKEKEELSLYANQIILNHITDIIDDFNRALNEDELSKEGIGVIYNKMVSLLNQYDLEEIKCAKGDKFNPETMEAVTAIHTQNEKEKNTVMDILSKGYFNNKNKKIYKTVKVITGK